MNYLIRVLYKGKLVCSLMAYQCSNENEAKRKKYRELNMLLWDELVITESL